MNKFRYANKRVGGRAANGQFARLGFEDVFGVKPNDQEQICDDCGHCWWPLVLSGKCPKCDSQDKHPVPPPEITPEIQVKIDALREIRKDGFIDPQRVGEAIRLERELQPWIKAGLVYG